jgi:uncharacterized protein DUF2829
MFGFGKALDVLRGGDAVRRASWNHETFSGFDFLILVPGSVVTVDADRPLGKAMPALVGDELEYRAHIDRCHQFNDLITCRPWRASDEDLLAEDWEYVN